MEEKYIVVERVAKVPDDYKYDCETTEFYVYRHKYTGDEIHIAKEPLLYLPIEKNLTNGDVMKKLFPNYNFYEVTLRGLGNKLTTIKCNEADITFDEYWWNKEYKGDVFNG